MQTLYPLQVDNPAAGADFKFTPSAQSHVFLWSVIATLTTSANAGTRVPVLQVKDVSGNLISVDLGAGSQLVSSSQIWNWRSDGPVYTTAAGKPVFVQSCPSFWLPPGATVGPLTNAIDVADQWTGIFAWYWASHDLERAEAAVAITAALGA